MRQQIRPAAIPKLLRVQIFFNPLRHVANPRKNCTIVADFNGFFGAEVFGPTNKSGRTMSLFAPTEPIRPCFYAFSDRLFPIPLADWLSDPRRPWLEGRLARLDFLATLLLRCDF
jgi:hypothetical protein